MVTLVREERFIVLIGAEEVILRVQELVSGLELWPQRCRVQIPASHTRGALTCYGATPQEVAERAAKELSAPASREVVAQDDLLRGVEQAGKLLN